MKIAFTLADPSAYLNYGGEVERITFIQEIPDEHIPKEVIQYLKWRNDQKQSGYLSMSISLVPNS
jgi:hypothetical protein